MGVTARGLAKAAEILADQFTLVATNVPYLGAKKQDDVLKDYCGRVHPDAKSDLATCFVERCLGFCAPDCSTSLVTPQNWLFLSTYKKLRQRLLEEMQWTFVARLGEHAFESPQAAGAFVALLGMSKHRATKSSSFAAIEAAAEGSPEGKADKLQHGLTVLVAQSGQLDNPDSRITFDRTEHVPLLEIFATNHQGLSTGDNPRFRRSFWEVAKIDSEWEAEQSTVESIEHYGGRAGILLWEGGRGRLYQFGRENVESLHNVDRRGEDAWEQLGVAIAQMRELPATLYGGQKFDTNVAVLIPKNAKHLPAIWAFCSSPEFHSCVRRIDQKVNVTNATLVKVPFDLAQWQKVAVEKYPNGLPKPFSSDPTQWLFNGHPKGSDQPLQVVAARLLAYRWPRQTGSSFPDCPALGPDGLEKLADEDGTVCINPIKGEQPAAERLRALLAASFRAEWTSGKQNELLEQVGFGGKTLEDWLRNGFFEQHCQLSHQRPFIWHVWDGRRDGFSALVNYHKLNRSNLEKLTYTFLGDWISRQKAANDAGEEGSDARLQAAQELKSKLEKIIEGEAPYDIFVRWKPIERQPIGWEPDLNDGVRLNIRPFVEAGVLRKDPKINWKKDRGKDVASAPWYNKYDLRRVPDYKPGDRINDYHLTLEEKKNARGKS